MRRPHSTPRSLRRAAPTDAPARRRLLLLSGLLTFAASAGVLALNTLPQAEAAEPAATSFYANFKGMTLVDQDGRPVVPLRLARRIVLVNFVYTGCATACSVQTRALADLQSRLPGELRSRVHLLSISIDPLNDTPRVLKAFATRMGADLAGWTFATGRPEDVHRLSEALRLFRTGTGPAQPEEHSTALWLVDPHGQLRMRYGGVTPDVQRLLRELPELDRLERQRAS